MTTPTNALFLARSDSPTPANVQPSTGTLEGPNRNFIVTVISDFTDLIMQIVEFVKGLFSNATQWDTKETESLIVDKPVQTAAPPEIAEVAKTVVSKEHQATPDEVLDIFEQLSDLEILENFRIIANERGTLIVLDKSSWDSHAIKNDHLIKTAEILTQMAMKNQEVLSKSNIELNHVKANIIKLFNEMKSKSSDDQIKTAITENDEKIYSILSIIGQKQRASKASKEPEKAKPVSKALVEEFQLPLKNFFGLMRAHITFTNEDKTKGQLSFVGHNGQGSSGIKSGPFYGSSLSIPADVSIDYEKREIISAVEANIKMLGTYILNKTRLNKDGTYTLEAHEKGKKTVTYEQDVSKKKFEYAFSTIWTPFSEKEL